MILDSIIVEAAVHNLIPKIKINSGLDWRFSCECDLFKEMVLCILSSSSKYEVAILYTNKLERQKCFTKATCNKLDEIKIYELLIDPVLIEGRSIRYRFPKVKSRQIFETINNIYGQGRSIKELLNNVYSSTEARDILTRQCSGVGYKQASMFLRNIGFGYDLAIIDTHIIDYLKLINILPSRIKVQNQSRYLKIETLYSEYAYSKQYDIKKLDIAFWNIMRIYKLKFT